MLASTLLILAAAANATGGNERGTTANAMWSDFDVSGPTGTRYADHHGARVWNREPPLLGTFYLSEASLGLRIDSKDRLGAYRVRTTVIDKVAHISVTTEQVLTALETP